MPIIRSPSNCRCRLWFPYECGGGSVLSRGRFVNKHHQEPVKLPLQPWSRFPHKTLYTPLTSPMRATRPAHLILLDFITRTILGDEYRTLSSTLCSFLYSRYLIPLRPKYSPQHPILKHPQPTFLTQCQRPSFTPIQNHRQNHSSVYLNL